MFRVNQIKEEEEEKMGPEEEGQQQATTVTARSSSSLTKIKIKLINEERSNKQQVASFKLFKSILILVLVYVLIQINSNLNLNSKNLLVSCTKLNEELESTTRKENQSFLLKSAQLNSWLGKFVHTNIRTQSYTKARKLYSENNFNLALNIVIVICMCVCVCYYFLV